MTLSVRRSVAALAVGAALALSGCGDVGGIGPAGPDRAAVIGEQVITERSMQAAMAEVNSMNPQLITAQLTPSSTLTALVQAPVILDYLADSGVVVSDSIARQAARQRGIDDPSDTTLQIVRLALALSSASESGALGDAEAAELTEQLQSLEVVVNPRYGAFDPTTATVVLGNPDWVTAADSGS